ncbi:MAG: endolytic transglycosylase MltG [Sphingobacteriales bacterium]|nr:endolytic transglycosylase MltG [Sphingobacteriales bacterium]
MKTSFKKIIGFLILLLLLLAGVAFFMGYRLLYAPNTHTSDSKPQSLYVPRNSTFETLMDSLERKQLLKDEKSFRRLARLMKFDSNVKSGHYLIADAMSNRSLIQKLRSGSQDPVSLTLDHIRSLSDWSKAVAAQTDINAATLDSLLQDSLFLATTYQRTPDNVMTMLIPNTYEIYWNISPNKLLDKMQGVYEKFWTKERLQKAENQKMTQMEVLTLASIVEEEAYHNEEKEKIAGVYLNRLRKGWPLQADPTVRFAVGNFDLKRITSEHLSIDSPYNTYKYAGLPPTPIRFPSQRAIDAVLNAEEHDYYFFCAKEDFSMYHNFATTYDEHILNAQRYRRALDSKNIR